MVLVDLVAVTVTADDPGWLAAFVRGLVEDRLAACGNIVPGVRSIYRWQGKVEDARESLAVLHTTADRVAPIIERADREHSYDTPQVVAVTVTDAHPGYRAWVLAETGHEQA